MNFDTDDENESDKLFDVDTANLDTVDLGNESTEIDEEDASNNNGEVREDEDDQEDEEEEEDDPLGNWRQLVFQRPGEAIVRLELFSAGSTGFEHLLVLNLQQNAIQDISPLLSTAHTLRVLNVSQNEIGKLPGTEFWSCFRRLTLCFLAHNRIQHWRDMDGLEACSATVLWLTVHGNPIAALANARPFLVNKLPFLRALDDSVVTDCEFMKAHGESSLV